MPTEHFLPGKEASLEASIAHMQHHLARLGFRLEERAWLKPMSVRFMLPVTMMTTTKQKPIAIS